MWQGPQVHRGSYGLLHSEHNFSFNAVPFYAVVCYYLGLHQVFVIFLVPAVVEVGGVGFRLQVSLQPLPFASIDRENRYQPSWVLPEIAAALEPVQVIVLRGLRN